MLPQSVVDLYTCVFELFLVKEKSLLLHDHVSEGIAQSVVFIVHHKGHTVFLGAIGLDLKAKDT